MKFINVIKILLAFFNLPFCKKLLIKEEDANCLLIISGCGLTTL